MQEISLFADQAGTTPRPLALMVDAHDGAPAVQTESAKGVTSVGCTHSAIEWKSR